MEQSESFADRKKRLAAMRLEASGLSQVEEAPAPPSDSEAPLVRFRNYVPHDASLDIKGNDHDISADSEAAVTKRRRGNGETKDTGEEESVADLVKRELEQQKRVNKQISSSSVLPKKLDSDLKALVSGKLQKLQRRTQRAIVDIMRTKLAAPEYG